MQALSRVPISIESGEEMDEPSRSHSSAVEAEPVPKGTLDAESHDP
jgi:hypothetical protein